MSIALVLAAIAIIFLVLWLINQLLAYSVTGVMLFTVLCCWLGFTLAVSITLLAMTWLIVQMSLL